MKLFGIRLYGTSDPGDTTPPANEGMRGERAARAGGGSGDERIEDVNGRQIAVEETSGVARAEAAIDAGNKDRDPDR